MSRAIAVLRPEPGNARTAARVESLGLAAIRLPLFVVAPIAWAPPDPIAYDTLVATSANAFRHGGEGLASLHGLPVVAVGEASAAAARVAGFTVEAAGDHDAEALVTLATGRLLHLAGRDHRAIPGADTIVVYAAEPLPADTSALAGRVALLHSPRSARRLADLVAPGDRATIRLAALSPAVAEAAGDGWDRVAAANAPRDDVLVAVAAGLAVG